MKYTGNDLVIYATYQLGKPYWYGTFGQIATAALYTQKSKQYSDMYNKWPKESFVVQYGQKVHDCSGLVKGLFMTPDALTQPNAPAVYDSKYDWSANGLIEACEEQGPISLLQEIPGLILWKNGHVGIYVGGGNVIEAKGHAYGVIRSKLSDTNWVRWGKCPYLDYSSKPKPIETCSVTLPVLRKGSTGEEVERVQLILNYLKVPDDSGKSLKIDGHFGDKTAQAVKRFKKAQKLGSTDEVNVYTWTRLIKG